MDSERGNVTNLYPWETVYFPWGKAVRKRKGDWKHLFIGPNNQMIDLEKDDIKVILHDNGIEFCANEEIVGAELGEYLESLRKQKRLSLRDAAEKSGLSYTYIRDIELEINRKTKKKVIPTPVSLRKLAKAYGVSYLDLLKIAGILSDKNSPEE